MTQFEKPATAQFTTNETATLLGIHATTLKRWCDNGEVDARKTSGGHRRFTARHIQAIALEKAPFSLPAQIELDATQTLVAWQNIERGNYGVARKLFRDWLAQGRANLMATFAETSLHGEPERFARFCDELVMPVMSHVGLDWQQGKITITQEHHYTSQMSQLLRQTRVVTQPAKTNVSSQTVLLLCAEHNLHSVALIALEALTRSCGIDVVNLGANVPNDEIVDAALTHRAERVCISFGGHQQMADVERTVRAIRRHRAAPQLQFALGGQPFTQGSATTIDGDQNFSVHHSISQYRANLLAKGRPS